MTTTMSSRTANEAALIGALYGGLLAAARATIAADALGQPEAIAILRGYLAEHGQLPLPGDQPAKLLAHAAPGIHHPLEVTR